ncbi:MAG: methylthioribulose 1-phosphate dehydratase [Acidobacteria bacterium]|nr:MAG: methylthioribulose 1-phosphate dehydratase [Acidobacteriota bacterium]
MDTDPFKEVAVSLARLGPHFYSRRQPLRLAITSSSVDKSDLTADHILQIDGEGNVLEGRGKPSAETLLHLAVVRLRGAGAVLHTHSVWSNILSDAHAPEGGLSIEGYEMLKGLEGVSTHEHREWVPVIDNSQDMTRLAGSIEETLKQHPGAHAFLLRRHGLYTWGKDLSEAKRHVEILEFLLEVMGRTYCPS